MASKPCSKIAVVDFDDTLVEGTLASRIIKRLIRKRGILPKRYYLKALRYSHLPILTKLKRFYRIYRYLLRRTYRLYLDLLEDSKVDKEKFFSVVKEVIDELKIPEESREFLNRLKKKGYRVVLVTAIPQEIADLLKEKTDVDEVIGSRKDLILDREGKERVVKELRRKGCVEIIVGNPGNEPFWLAEKLAVIVRSPKDLRRWVLRL